MVDLTCGTRFLLEAAQAIGVGRERSRKDLQSDVAIEARVAGAINLSHAALADRRDDPVAVWLGRALQWRCSL